jgi:hypothetical protein
MREAGWSESTGAVVEGPVSFSDEEISSLESGRAPAPQTGELTPGEIPEWLKAVAPKPPAPEESLPETWGEGLSDAQAGGAPPWLEEPEAALGPEATAEPAWTPPSQEAPAPPPEPAPAIPADWAAEPAQAEPEPATADEEGQPLPSWLEEPSPGATDTIITWLGDRAARDTGDLAMPDWMREAQEPPSVTPEEAFPSFLSEQPEPEAPAAPAGEPGGGAPGWLAGVADAAAQQEPLQPEELAALRERGETGPLAERGEEWAEGQAEAEGPRAPREAPDWLRGIIEPESAQPAAPAEPSAGPSWLAGSEPPRPRSFAPAPEPDWLRGLGEPSTPGAEAPQEVPEAPGWLKSIQEAREPEPVAAPPPRAPEEMAPAIAGDEAEDWLRELDEAPSEAPPVEAAAQQEPSALAQAELPDWLSGLAPEEAPAEAELPSEEELGGALGWLEEEPVAATPALGAEQLPAAEETLAPAAEVSGEEDVLEWLEGLAAQQTMAASTAAVGAEPALEEEPLVEERVLPEEPAEGLEWLERLASTRGVEPEEEGALGALEASALEEAPDWLKQAEEPFPAAGLAEAEGSLDWLEAAEQEPAAEPAPPTVPSIAAAPGRQEDIHVPTWLLDASKVPPIPGEPSLPPDVEETLAEAYEEPVEAGPAPVEAPDWLQGRVPAAEAFEVEAEFPQEPSEPSWMGAGEEPPRAAGEELEETVPDWLRAPAEPQAGAAPEPEPSVWEPVPPPRFVEPAPTPAPLEPEPIAGPEVAEVPIEAAPPPSPVPEFIPSPPEPEPVMPRVAAPAPVEPIPSIPELPPAPVRAEPPPVPEAAPPAAPAPPAPTPPPVTPAPVYVPAPPVVPPVPPRPAPAYPAPQAPPPTPAPHAPAAPTYPPPITPAYTPPPAYQPPSPQTPPAPYWPPPPPAPAYTPPPIIPPRQAPAYPAAAYPPAAAAVSQPQYAPAPPPAAAPPKGKAGAGADEALERAREAMKAGQIDEALGLYAGLVKRKRQLNSVIQDLQKAVEGGSVPPAVWQALGDALMKADRLNEAIESYRHGLEAV